MKIFIIILCLFTATLASAGEKFDKMTPAEHLKYAKDAISKNAAVPAKMHLDAIPRQAREYAEAKELYVKLGDKQADSRRASEEKAKKIETQRLLAVRKVFAKEYERSLLDKGFDAYASTHGKNHTTLKLKWVLISRPLVHKVCNDMDLIERLRSMGFKKFILSDGYENSWTVDL